MTFPSTCHSRCPQPYPQLTQSPPTSRPTLFHPSPIMHEQDPSIADGYRVIYDREVPFELRLHEANAPQQVGTLEAVKAKVLVLGDEHSLQSIRVELSSEADLFFHYMHVIDEVRSGVCRVSCRFAKSR